MKIRAVRVNGCIQCAYCTFPTADTPGLPERWYSFEIPGVRVLTLFAAVKKTRSNQIT
jgi:hypothetical protein